MSPAGIVTDTSGVGEIMSPVSVTRSSTVVGCLEGPYRCVTEKPAAEPSLTGDANR